MKDCCTPHAEVRWHIDSEYHSSFPVIHKVGNVDIFVLLKYDKYKTTLKFIHLVLLNVFSLEIIQKCQYCHLCILPENSIADLPNSLKDLFLRDPNMNENPKSRISLIFLN